MSAVNDVETSVGHERHKIVEFHPSVFVKVSKRATMSGPFHPEVHHQQTTAGLQDAPNFSHAGLARGPAKVMKHHGARDDVELPIGERERLRAGDLERDIDVRARCFFASSSDHFGRCVDPADRPGTDASFGGNGERSGPTADVEHRLAWRHFGEIEHFFAERPFTAEREQRDEQIITLCPCHDAALILHRTYCFGADGGVPASVRTVILMILSSFGYFTSRYLFVSL